MAHLNIRILHCDSVEAKQNSNRCVRLISCVFMACLVLVQGLGAQMLVFGCGFEDFEGPKVTGFKCQAVLSRSRVEGFLCKLNVPLWCSSSK